MMKNILIISALFPPEPVVSAKLSFDLAEEISKTNNLVVISPHPSRPYNFIFNKTTETINFIHILINSFTSPRSNLLGRIRESYSFGKYSYQYIKNNNQNIDTIYANTWPLLGQYFVIKAAITYNIPTIIHVQDIYPESLTKKFPFAGTLFNFILMPLEKYILENANTIIAISQKMKNYLALSRNIETNKIKVVPNWQDEELFINYKGSNYNNIGRHFTFMYLGNIGPVAGLDLLLKAFAKAQIKNSKLVIAGSGSVKDSLVKLAENYPNCIIEFWTVPDGKVAEIQREADVLILPVKKGEAFFSIPSKLPAYMFSAKPIIACVDEDSDTAVAINEAKCGWVIPPEDIEQLSALMLEIVSEPFDNIKDYGINGKNYAIANYSKKNNLNKLISIINETIPSNIISK